MNKVVFQSKAFVYGQFTLIVLVLVGCQKAPEFSYTGALIMAAGLLLGAWTLANNRPENININPMPKAGATLCFSGPYRFVRHPMYLALLVALVGMVVMNTCYLSIVSLIALVVLLERKASLEERLLRESSSDYEQYQKKTARFIPLLY